MKKNNKTAILLLTHIINKRIEDIFSELNESCADKFDVFILCDNTNGAFSACKGKTNYFLFDVSQLIALKYPGKSAPDTLLGLPQADPHHQLFNFDPANVELPILSFFKSHPDYANYWTIEYDVRFTGNWDTLFATFDTNDADLLGTTLTRQKQIPTWHHWPSMELPGKTIGADSYLRGFFPIYRLSRRALLQLDRDYRAGMKGHFECLIPTLLYAAGMKIEDIGGDGEFVRPANRNRFYRNTPLRGPLTPGTFVYRPAMHRPGKERNMLWHPVRYAPPWQVGLRKMKRLILSAARIPGRLRIRLGTRIGNHLP